ncbi:MAG: aspartate carbamoyltransferase regulatory subunit [Thermoplasmata archaeon]
MKELKVQPIKNGTVIDHITSGMALKVLKILDIPKRDSNAVISILMNAPSKSTSVKDIVKIEGRELKPKEVDKIALISPTATINIIREYDVIEKRKVTLPNVVKDILKCENPNCISNKSGEPIEKKFNVISREPVMLKCWYCEREQSDVVSNILD